MNRSRLTLAGLEGLVEQLSERDLDIVMTLRRVRVATTVQLERLHFTDGTPLSNARGCRRTLERLTRDRVLHRLDRRIGGVRAGSASFVYCLGVGGQRLAGERGPAGGGRIRRPWTPSGPFLQHALAVAELYVHLVEATRRDDYTIERFDAEPDCWRSFTGAGGERQLVKPDAYTVMSDTEFEDRWFIELDRATESPNKLHRHAEGYRRYWQAGIEQARSGVFPKVLFVVPDGQRAAVVTKALARQPADAWRLFQVTTFAHATEVLSGGES
jgi:hypothetical protein